MKSALLAVTLALFAANASAQALDTIAEPVLEAAPVSDAPKAPGRRSLVSSRLSAAVNTREAERRLAQSQTKRSLGLAPLPGESVRAPGGIVVNARYWNRQEKLRIEVEQAQRRLNRVQKPQVAVR